MGAIKNHIGRYEILRELGHGAMGVVYAAVDSLIGRQVAIKTIRLDALGGSGDHEELTRRLYREAQSAGILSHPGIITIYDVGEQENEAYIVMEYVDGRNLEIVLASGAPQHAGTLISILKQAAIALDYAHSKGIIHRDIKPANIMICRDGSVKIEDFGIAKLSASASMTQSGLVLGTPSYMSPEQAQGHTVDGRSDQFSLAVIAYRMLTGQLPFQGATLTALLTKILLEEPQYDSAGLHPYLQLVFKKALAKLPQLRFSSCVEFTQDLEAAYALCKAEMPNIAAGSAEKSDAPDKSKAASPDTGIVAESRQPAPGVSTPIQAEGNAQSNTSQSPSPVIHSRENVAAVDGNAIALSLQSPAPKRKSALIAWAASLAVIALAVMAFFTIKTLNTPDPAVQNSGSTAVPAVPAKTIQDQRAVIREEKPEPAPPQQAKPKKRAESNSKREQTDTERIALKAVPAPVPDRAQAATNAALSDSGTIVWSGDLEKNAILVISGRKASIGQITGELPGIPVRIEVEAKGVRIRLKPSAENNWKEIMLYSGNRKYASITIRWKKL